jgi:predicted amidohydrolase
MKIGYLQFAPKFGEIEANLLKVRELIGDTSCDLLVLPELFSTGYTFRSPKELRGLSETVTGGRTVHFLRELSAQRRMAVVGGFPELQGKKVYNSSILCLPHSRFYVYRKKHLYHHEKKFFAVAHDAYTPQMIEGGVKLGLLICFDWIFPEAMRALSLAGAHIICHSANLVLSYCQDAMITRALENRVFIITANRTGTEVRGRFTHRFTGMSQIVSPEGRILCRAGEREEAVSVVRINPRDAQDKKITPLNDIFQDRRKGLYKGL